MLKSKATGLARAGESVTYIFMGGSGKTEAVMSIANKIDFANNPNITVLSQQDLEEKYREEHPWWPSVPSPLFLIKFYIEKEKPKHLMVDEVPLEKASTWKQLLRLPSWILASLLSSFGLKGAFIFGGACVLLTYLPSLFYDGWVGFFIVRFPNCIVYNTVQWYILYIVQYIAPRGWGP